MLLNMVGGGAGGASAYAYIAVNYPEGYTCYCTDNIKRIDAKDTSGNVVFDVPYAATWNIFITIEGGLTKSTPVVITKQGEVKLVTITVDFYLVDGTYIYPDYGTTSAFGGAVTITPNGDNMLFHCVDYVGSVYWQDIDLTHYSTLKVKVKMNSTPVDHNACRVRIIYNWESEIAFHLIPIGLNEFEMDISLISGNHIIQLQLNANGQPDMNMYEIKLLV